MTRIGAAAPRARQFSMAIKWAWLAPGALALGLAACGGGGGGSGAAAPEAMPPQRLVAEPPGSRVAASYNVVNLGSGASTGQRGINATGQVAFFKRIATRWVAYLYDGTSIQGLGVLPGRDNAQAVSINDSGQVAGTSWSTSSTAPQRAFLWTPTGAGTGTMVDVGSLMAGGHSTAVDINNAGQVAGYSTSPVGLRAFSWTPTGATSGVMSDVGTLAGYSFAIAINDAGQVLGRSFSAGQERAFLWTPAGGTTGALIDLGSLGGSLTRAMVINDSGQVAGYARTAGSTWTHAFAWTPTGTTSGVMTDLGTLGGSYSYAQAINGAGQVAGIAYVSGSTYHAFLWENSTGVMTDLGTLGGSNSQATAMNEAGQVVGWANAAGSTAQRAFAWTQADGMVDLNARIPGAPAGLELYDAVAISDNGSIVARSSAGLVLLQPEAASSAAPALGPISADDPVAVGTPVTVSASFTDADSGDTHTGAWSWADGASQPALITESDGSGTAAGTHVFADAGVYSVTLQVTDNTGRSAEVSRDVVVYDPAAGFVTGGGWIMSPAGAYKAEPQLAGRATYGFVSKYKRGATTPSGKTEFQFQAANLNFHSESYDWLVIAGARAQYKGEGTLNGQPGFKFMLTAVDGQVAGGGGSDRFRIKIWHYDADAEADVLDYDNQLDASTEGSAQEGTVVGGGSIVIHR